MIQRLQQLLDALLELNVLGGHRLVAELHELLIVLTGVCDRGEYRRCFRSGLHVLSDKLLPQRVCCDLVVDHRELRK